MQRGKTGPGGPERAGAEQVNAAPVRLLIADALAQLSGEHRAVIRRSYYLGWTTAQIAEDLQIAECTVKSRLHFALGALRLTLQRHPARRALAAPGHQRQQDGALPSPQVLPATACDVDHQGAGPHSPGVSGIRER
jgi:Sigma-70, region 4